MTENFYNLVMTLMRVADESACQNLGYKGKPYLELPDIPKYAYNIKKQDKRAFEEIHKRVTGEEKTFEEIISSFHYASDYNKRLDEMYKSHGV